MSASVQSTLDPSRPAGSAAEGLTLPERLAAAQQAFGRYQTSCFWSAPADLKIDAELIPWVASGLRKNGDRAAFIIARRIHPCP